MTDFFLKTAFLCTQIGKKPKGGQMIDILIKLLLMAVRNLRLVLFGFILVLMGGWILMGRSFLEVDSSKDYPANAGVLRRSEASPSDDERNNRIPYEIELVKIAANAGLWRNEQQLQEFLLSHGTICQILAADPDERALNDYLDRLSMAQSIPRTWEVVWNDPAGLVLWPLLQNHPELWQFYERERDWLAEILAELAIQENGIDDTGMVEAIKAAHRFHPLAKKMILNEHLGVTALGLFMAYGPIIATVSQQKCIPIPELLEVLYLNGSYIEITQNSETLCQIYQNHLHVWLYAKHFPDVMEFYDDLPELADKILEQYGDDRVVERLVGYGDRMESAAHALSKFGDVAFVLLDSQKNNPQFKRWLGEPQVGMRLIPFLQKFGVEEGLERLNDNPAWAAKYFQANGDLNPPSLITAIPFVGGPANVASNFMNGYPNEWSELGWAAFDVASTGLLALSFGTTSAATAGGRHALMKANQQVIKNGSKAVMKPKTKAPLRTGTGKGIQSATRASSLKRTITTASQVTTIAGSAMARSSRNVWQAGRRLKTQWQTIPPLYRKTTYRALLGTSLYLTVKHRTLPLLSEDGAERIGQAAGKVVDTLLTKTGVFLAEAFKAAKSEQRSAFETPLLWGRRFIYFTGISGLFLAATWCLYPTLRRI